jgi:hypothetical protein
VERRTAREPRLHRLAGVGAPRFRHDPGRAALLRAVLGGEGDLEVGAQARQGNARASVHDRERPDDRRTGPPAPRAGGGAEAMVGAPVLGRDHAQHGPFHLDRGNDELPPAQGRQGVQAHREAGDARKGLLLAGGEVRWIADHHVLGGEQQRVAGAQVQSADGHRPREHDRGLPLGDRS